MVGMSMLNLCPPSDRYFVVFLSHRSEAVPLQLESTLEPT